MSVIDEYFAQLGAPEREALERIRQIVRTTVPEAEEVISYGMPGFTYKGKYLVGLNAFRDHLSLFPTSAPVEAFRERLRDFTLSKGTIQFTLEKPVPEAL